MIIDQPSTLSQFVVMSSEALEAKLSKLQAYLEGLHTLKSLDVPESGSRYSFDTFALDKGWVMDIGEVSAVNHELETWLGSRSNGPIKFTERGPAVEALIDVFRLYLTKFSGDIILEKWLDDAIEGAINTYKKANTPVSSSVGLH